MSHGRQVADNHRGGGDVSGGMGTVVRVEAGGLASRATRARSGGPDLHLVPHRPPESAVGPPVTGGRVERDRALAALFDDHYLGLCRLAWLILGDRDQAEEVVQEAFLRTFTRWRSLRQPDRAPWYLRAAVVNLSRSRLRRRSTEARGNQAVAVLHAERWLDDLGIGPAVGGARPGTAGRATRPGTAAADGDRAAEHLAVVEAVRALPPRQRAAVVLRYYEDLPEAEIAALLGCSTGTVKSQLAKARASLARRLGGDDDGDDHQGVGGA